MFPRSPSSRAAWAAFAVTLPVYFATMNRTIGFVDRGELSAAAVTFGISHPTGYPTLMLLAGALAHLVPLRPILVLNALAAVLTAAGAGVLTLLLDRVLAAIGPLAAGLRAVYALLAGLIVAFTLTWWQQANGFEVYSLHVVLMSLIVLLFLRWTDLAAADGDGPASPAAKRAGWAFAFTVGLSFTNHLTTALLAPGLLAAAALRFGAGGGLWRRVWPLAPAFLLPLPVYLWLPLRSAQQPRFDWGDPETLGGFLRHISGAQYHGMMFDPERMGAQVRYLVWRAPGDFSWLGLVVVALGAALLARRARGLAVAAFGFLAAGGLFAAAYGVPDPDAYLLTALLGASLCLAAGLFRLHERFGARVAIAAAAALVLANVALHARDCDESGNRLAEGFVRDVLGPLPANAVLFTDMWEILDSGSRYLQEVEGFRRDVVVLSAHLSHSPWYLDELERRAPGLTARARPELDAYRAARRAGEQGRLSGPEVEAALNAFVDAFAAGCMRDRQVFATGGLAEVRGEWQRVPWHMVLWLRPDSAYVPETAWRPGFRPWLGRRDLYHAMTYQAYAEARLERARYEAGHGRLARARELVDGVVAFDPGIPPEAVAPLPLGFDRYVLFTAQFFRELRSGDPLAALP